MKLPFGYSLNRNVQKSETPPHPDNRAYNLSYFNQAFTIDGEYKPQDGEESSVVSATINWLTRALLDTPLRLYAGETEIERHFVLDLLRAPNARHSYRNFLWSNIRSLVISGSVAVEILQPLGLAVIPYQWLRRQLPQDQYDQMRYKVQSWTKYRDVPADRVVDILWQPYDRNQAIGESPLVPVYPLLKLDRIAIEGAAGRLASPVAGMIISPKETDSAPITDDEKEELRQKADDLRVSKAGQMMLVEGRFDVKELTGQVHRFSFKEMHDLCEARITGQLGVTAIAAQMGVGLSQSRVGATIKEEFRVAWTNGAMPMGNLLTEAWNRHLLPKLGVPKLRLAFDFSALDFHSEEEKNLKGKRIIDGKEAGLVDEADARELYAGLLR